MRIAVLSLCLLTLAGAADDKWVQLFDGKSLNGWKPSENTGSWKVVDGAITTNGARSHLFYVGKFHNADFKNFELKADVKAAHLANSGIFFHTEFQDTGWPSKGFEVQIANTATGEGGYIERKKTGSLYGVRNVYKQLMNDDEWFEMHIAVRGPNVRIRLNGTLVVDYVEAGDAKKKIGHGTFALQCHDPGSRVAIKNIRVKPLADNAAPENAEKPVVDDNYRDILKLSGANYPLVDYHVHLKGGLTLEQALANSRKLGIGYGIAVNCGVGFPINDDAGAEAFFASMKGQPAFIAMQAEGREWVKTFSPKTIAKFDYVFTDAMTFSDDNGKRMRLWIKEEVGEIPNKIEFADLIVRRIEGILNTEPIDIYVNATFLPDVMQPYYEQLWTPVRMDKVIAAAKAHNIAIEINNRYKIPSRAFIERAKRAGVKFTCGTNNTGAELGRNEYCIEMIQKCNLTWQDMWVPRPKGEKAR